MKTHMKQSSVDILNDADAFERMLNWQLFKQEQDSRLFGPDELEPGMFKFKWRPGDPMYMRDLSFLGAFSDQYVVHPYYDTNVGRPMFELFEENDCLDTPETSDLEEHDLFCMECQVSWFGSDDDPWGDYCWNCGQGQLVFKQYHSAIGYSYHDALTAFRLYSGDSARTPNGIRAQMGLPPIVAFDLETRLTEPIGHVTSITESARGMMVTYRIDDEAFREQFAQMIHRVDEAFAGFSSVMVQTGRRIGRSLAQLRLTNEAIRGPIEWPENINMEPDIPLPDPPFPEFQPPQEDNEAFWIDQDTWRRNR